MGANSETDPAALRVAYVPGVTPGKWLGRWAERSDRALHAFQAEEAEAGELLRTGGADMAFLRFPAEGYRRPETLNAVPLYLEQPVVVAPREHELTLFDELDLAALSGETLLDPLEMGGAKTGIEVVASGAGLMILPMAVARLYSRKDVAARPLRDAPATRIVLAWRAEEDGDDIQEFVGIVRGRTANSSRQPSAEAAKSGDRAGQARKPGRSGQARGSGQSGKAGGGRTARQSPGRPARRRGR